MSYQITQTTLPDALVIEPRVFSDDRGYFFEAYQKDKFHEAGITDEFIQDNEALSSIGALRGLHYQVGPFAQSKLVRVIRGSVYDVIVDIRPGSDCYGKWFGIELTAENKKQLYVPQGFAHGYLCLADNTVLLYKCNNFYSRDSEGGIRYDCPSLGIKWPEIGQDYIISEKDKYLPHFGNHRL